MENKLEQLLNSLIEKGWLPRNIKCNSVKSTDNCLEFYTELKTVGRIMKNERQLTSKESGLWQFVCENGMVKEGHKHERILDPTFGEGWADCKRQEHDGNYGYRLIESALQDESELEQFLLDNIKID